MGEPGVDYLLYPGSGLFAPAWCQVGKVVMDRGTDHGSHQGAAMSWKFEEKKVRGFLENLDRETSKGSFYKFLVICRMTEVLKSQDHGIIWVGRVFKMILFHTPAMV